MSDEKPTDRIEHAATAKAPATRSRRAPRRSMPPVPRRVTRRPESHEPAIWPSIYFRVETGRSVVGSIASFRARFF